MHGMASELPEIVDHLIDLLLGQDKGCNMRPKANR
jgi:hypothetical protein